MSEDNKFMIIVGVIIVGLVLGLNLMGQALPPGLSHSNDATGTTCDQAPADICFEICDTTRGCKAELQVDANAQVRLCWAPNPDVAKIFKLRARFSPTPSGAWIPYDMPADSRTITFNVNRTIYITLSALYEEKDAAGNVIGVRETGSSNSVKIRLK